MAVLTKRSEMLLDVMKAMFNLRKQGVPSYVIFLSSTSAGLKLNEEEVYHMLVMTNSILPFCPEFPVDIAIESLERYQNHVLSN